MTANVEQEEVDALLGESQADSTTEVSPRDFQRPLRLSQDDSAKLQSALAISLPQASKGMSEVFDRSVRVELSSLSEVHAERIFEEVEEPLTVMRFVAGGHPGWVQWETLPAIQSIETLLGATDTSTGTRTLSSIEARVLESLLTAAVTPVLEPLGASVEMPAIAQDRTALGSWKDIEGGDPHRVAIELTLTGLEEESTIHLFLGGLTGGGDQITAPEDALPAALPKSLNEIEVDVCVCLEGGEFALAQLLALEEGDVITLDSRPGDPVELRIEGEAIGQADWGQDDGWSAIRIRGGPTNE